MARELTWDEGLYEWSNQPEDKFVKEHCGLLELGMEIIKHLEALESYIYISFSPKSFNSPHDIQSLEQYAHVKVCLTRCIKPH